MNKEIIGYKGFDKDLKCKDFQYEIGKSYEINEKPEICKTGFHYCNNIIDIFRYKVSNSRICVIKAYGDIIEGDIKSCTNKIEILEEVYVSSEDRIRYVYAIYYNLSDDELKELLNKEFILDDYINDPDSDVRATVAKQGYGLDILINDKDWYVRATVAKQGYGLDKLINDPDSDVREAVAKQGYGLDILVNDPDSDVRAVVAKQGYGLDKLINDENWLVRKAVAKQGYGLDKLINDRNPNVKAASLDYIRNNPEFILSNYKSY